MPTDHEKGSRGLIWARPERAAKGPAPSRSRGQIAEAAVALADAEGLDAVSMRKVAAALGIGTASLYGYVAGKDELYDLMVDRVEGEDGPPPPPSGDWRADLSGMAHKIRGSILRHPWMASVAAERPSFGPNSLAWNEYGLAALDDLGLTIDEMLIASEIVQAFVRGFATRELAEQQALQRAGLDAEEWGRVLAPYVESVERSGDYPRFSRVVRDAHVPHAPDRQDLIFATGLGHILDGLLKR
ncbi:TetR family transcriptional regulator [Paractinoplanes deccanensis]|uniref:TetR family transcriptional regulator n=1 Tax=Paractinoplanes deccanensis TaxID=113561 RepID=A0ABQ3XY66_9ACTN|nr:TetR/AcrR family transcriptional regulator [Actinoplanes deccanensis]GID72670.1 TetR family transcriptional regulator [Actinoplanes deccanensis]